MYAGQPRDRRSERAPRVDEGGEALAGNERTVSAALEPDRADLDDAVTPGIEAGGLEVDRDELRASPIYG